MEPAAQGTLLREEAENLRLTGQEAAADAQMLRLRKDRKLHDARESFLMALEGDAMSEPPAGGVRSHERSEATKCAQDPRVAYALGLVLAELHDL